MSKSTEMPSYAAVILSPFGDIRLGIVCTEQSLISIDFLTDAVPLQRPATPLARQVADQIFEYINGQRRRFDLELAPSGTSFQQRVWQALQQIPYGQVISYGALARQLATSPRAIGNACRANPIPIVIPCHRVVAAHGLGGYGGDRIGGRVRMKESLLAHEHANSQ